MQGWLTPSLISLLSFGLWGFFTRLSTSFIDFKSAIVYQTIGVVIVGIVTLSMVNFKPATVSSGIFYAILTGFSYALGCLFYFIAADNGKVSTVVTLTALYPLVTIMLSYYYFQEKISGKNMLGIVLALIAIFLMIE